MNRQAGSQVSSLISEHCFYRFLQCEQHIFILLFLDPIALVYGKPNLFTGAVVSGLMKWQIVTINSSRSALREERKKDRQTDRRGISIEPCLRWTTRRQ